MDVVSQGGFWTMIGGATLVVKLVLIILAGLSIASWTAIFYKFFNLYGAKKRVRRELDFFVEAESLEKGLQGLGQNPNSNLYRIGRQALSEAKRLATKTKVDMQKAGIVSLKRVLERSVNKETLNLSRSLSFLATCGNSAPFIGLFGTVWGIMHSFHSISAKKSVALTTVAPGISEALVATAFGLAVAIPATIAYNTFLSMLHETESEMENFSGAFLNRVEQEFPPEGEIESESGHE